MEEEPQECFVSNSIHHEPVGRAFARKAKGPRFDPDRSLGHFFRLVIPHASSQAYFQMFCFFFHFCLTSQDSDSDPGLVLPSLDSPSKTEDHSTASAAAGSEDSMSTGPNLENILHGEASADRDPRAHGKDQEEHPWTSDLSQPSFPDDGEGTLLREFGVSESVMEALVEDGGVDDVEDEQMTTGALIQSLLELRDALNMARRVEQEQQQLEEDAQTTALSATGRLELSLGLAEHIDLDALIARAADGKLSADPVDCDVDDRLAALSASSRRLTNDELMEKLHVFSRRQSSLLEKSAQLPRPKPAGTVRRVHTMTWAGVGEGRRAVAVSSTGMSCQTTSLNEIGLSTDELLTRNVGASTSSAGMSWRDLLSPSTSMREGSSQPAAQLGDSLRDAQPSLWDGKR